VASALQYLCIEDYSQAIICLVDAWTPGTEYPVLIIASNADTYGDFVGTRGVNTGERGRKAGIASRDDLENARELLSAMLKALADSATGGGGGDLVRPIDLIDNEEQKTKMQELLSKLDSGTVDLPGPPFHECKVLKVYLQNCLDYEIPDPMLLAMKAAINWYYIKTTLKMLPACTPPEDPEEALIREMNEELIEQVRQEQLRPQSWEDLARGLGQYHHPSTPPTQSNPARVSLSPASSTPPRQTD